MKKTENNEEEAPYTASSVSEFIDKIFMIQGQIAYKNGLICYRGEGAKHPEVAPKVFRNEFDRANNSESRMLNDLFDEAPEEFSTDDCMLDRLVRAQHYGLPTRLLDVTLNPLVAVYFSCADKFSENKDGVTYCFALDSSRIKRSGSDTVSILCNMAQLDCHEQQKILGLLIFCYLDIFDRSELSADDLALNINIVDNFLRFTPDDTKPSAAKKLADVVYQTKEFRRLIHFIKKEKPYFENKLEVNDFRKTFFVYPRKNNKRVIAQSGAFLLSAFYNHGHASGTQFTKTQSVKIHQASKKKILEELNAININHSSLFPEIAEKARHIAERYRTK